MAQDRKIKKTAEDYDREYAEWLLGKVIQFGVDNPVQHHELLGGKQYSMTHHSNMSRAINFGHVRFTHDKRTMLTQHALWFLDRMKGR